MQKSWNFGIGFLVLFSMGLPGYAQEGGWAGPLPDTSAVHLVPDLRPALVELEKGNTGSAIVALREVVRLHENHIQALRLLASAYLRIEDYDQALEICRKIAALDSSDVNTKVALGYLYQKLNNLSMSEQHYQSARQMRPDLIQVYQGLGWIYLQTGRLEDALKMVSETTTRAPNYAPNYILQGRVLMAQGLFEEAAIAYNRAFALQSSLREEYGILLQELGLRHRVGH